MFREIHTIQNKMRVGFEWPSKSKFTKIHVSKTLYSKSGFSCMDSYAIIDKSDFPIIRIRFTGNKSTDQNFQTYLDQTKDCYRSGKRLAIIFDASDAAIPSLSHQKMQANWLKENEQLMKEFCAGTAYIIPNAAIRAILKMIFSFQKQPVPYKIFESEPEANTWVNGLDVDSNSTA